MRKVRLGVLWCWRGFVGLLAAWLLAVVPGTCSATEAFDQIYNMGSTPHEPSLRAPDDGRRHLVVLQHGLLRSSASLARLERTLLRHGYDVLNESYPSTGGWIQDHAERLRGHVERALAEDSRPAALYAIGHSMGGLVIQQWLAHCPIEPEACVFLGTPHRGASLADSRQDVGLLRLVAGEKAAAQLLSDDPFNARVIRNLGDAGVVVGHSGDKKGRSRTIPGDDDRAVAVVEALLPKDVGDGVRNRGVLWTHRHHTSMTVDPEVLVGVLRFLRTRSFDGG